MTNAVELNDAQLDEVTGGLTQQVDVDPLGEHVANGGQGGADDAPDAVAVELGRMVDGFASLGQNFLDRPVQMTVSTLTGGIVNLR